MSTQCIAAVAVLAISAVSTADASMEKPWVLRALVADFASTNNEQRIPSKDQVDLSGIPLVGDGQSPGVGFASGGWGGFDEEQHTAPTHRPLLRFSTNLPAQRTNPISLKPSISIMSDDEDQEAGLVSVARAPAENIISTIQSRISPMSEGLGFQIVGAWETLDQGIQMLLDEDQNTRAAALQLAALTACLTQLIEIATVVVDKDLLEHINHGDLGKKIDNLNTKATNAIKRYNRAKTTISELKTLDEEVFDGLEDELMKHHQHKRKYVDNVVFPIPNRTKQPIYAAVPVNPRYRGEFLFDEDGSDDFQGVATSNFASDSTLAAARFRGWANPTPGAWDEEDY